MVQRHTPTRKEILAAEGRIVPDLIAPGLRVLFCGINPGLYSGAVGHHFARPGNRFWPVIHASGFTRRLLSPFEEHELLESGYGLTNIVERSTAGARDLSRRELKEGARRLEAKVLHYRPRFVAFLGIGAYRTAFDLPGTVPGRQDRTIGRTAVWVLPSPSGLNAHYEFSRLVRIYSELHRAVEHE
ncbi:MAG TPA: G/U mismatch-specific DNA glycosylase [Deltaproteobacteria bacterium]|nr:G/U mismatch-specific DNA glycosylase [Deltaproteobacteria bacterium]HPV28438.1 G/U mismatch-specific DNA glycosylase [Deltaproteobacteria bacterium]HRC97797.1 G/U mismatch-specific DNA glycosylase [Deltaproteobacteria bacterium]